MFTKQHYVKVAELLKSTELKAYRFNYTYDDIFEEFTRRIADLFEQDNERFHREKFIDAATPDWKEVANARNDMWPEGELEDV